MEARLRAVPTFSFDLDLTAIIKLERALSFYRNAHALERDTETDQLLQLFKTTLEKIREYDAALRGLQLSTSASKIEPDVEDEPEPPPKKETPQKPQASKPSQSPPGIPPGSLPPWFDPMQTPTTGQAPTSDKNLSEVVKPKQSGVAPPPPSSKPQQISEDDAVKKTLPGDSGVAPPPPSKNQAGPPGGFPSFGPPGSIPPSPPSGNKPPPPTGNVPPSPPSTPEF